MEGRVSRDFQYRRLVGKKHGNYEYVEAQLRYKDLDYRIEVEIHKNVPSRKSDSIKITLNYPGSSIPYLVIYDKGLDEICDSGSVNFRREVDIVYDTLLESLLDGEESI